jgi:hypothetical protein
MRSSHVPSPGFASSLGGEHDAPSDIIHGPVPRIHVLTRPALSLKRSLSPWGRGREAMIYGLARFARRGCHVDCEAVSHKAELVRGDCAVARPPHPALRATFSPRGEGLPSRTTRGAHP